MQVSSLASTIARRRKYSSFGISRNAFSKPVVRYTHEQPPVVNLLIKRLMWKRAKSTLIIVVTQLANASLLPENASTWLDDVEPSAKV